MRNKISLSALKDETELPDFEDLASLKSLVHSEPWDVLIVLDACRWDAYNYIFERNATPVRNAGEGSTLVWTDEVWCHEVDGWSDVTYISANIQTGLVGNRYKEDSNEIVDCVGEYIELPDIGDMSDQIEPSVMVEHAMEVEPPMVLHFLQPHTPFIGDFSLSVYGRDNFEIFPEYEEGGPMTGVQRLVYHDLVDRDVLKTAYLSNLRYVAPHVRDVTYHFADRGLDVVVTADHGEAFGPDHWDHGGNTSMNRVVPWDRRKL